MFLYLINFLVKLLVMLLCIRFHTRGYFLPANVLVKKLRALTDPIVLPFDKFLPSKRFDRAALAVALLLCVLYALVLTRSLWLGMSMGALRLLSYWSDLVFYCLVISVIASWLQTPPQQPVLQIVYSCSEWCIAPIRRVIPSVGGLDFSPMVAFFGLVMFQMLLYSIEKSLLLSMLPKGGV